MRALLIIIDGLGDEPIPAFQGKTPFAHAAHPLMDALCASEEYFSICENDLVPESCSCILRLLGVAKEDMPQNRAYLELLAHERDISEFEMVLRCNLVATDAAGRLLAFNGRGLAPAEMREAAKTGEEVLSDLEFIHLSEYRNLLIMNKEASVLDCAVPPPHESLGEDFARLLAPLRASSLSLKYFLQETSRRLAFLHHDGLDYHFYPWGASARQKLPRFQDLHGISGGVVAKAEIVVGIARALNMEVLTPPGATGEIDTDVRAKARAAQELLARHDFVLAHFNGSDEASHRYDYEGKAQFISRIEREFLAPLLEDFAEPLKIIICGDHVTSSLSGKHGAGPVPVLALYAHAGGSNAGEKNCRVRNYRELVDFLMKASD